MAELNSSQSGKAAVRRKAAPRVDLTAMVDLAFLLITFFMLTTSLSKDQALDVVKPVPIADQLPRADWPASRTMTIILASGNKAVYYMGEAKNQAMEVVDLSTMGKQLLKNKHLVAQTHTLPKDKVMLVIIKPTEKANYKNLVDILDEMNINQVATYAIDDKNILKEELEFVKMKGI